MKIDILVPDIALPQASTDIPDTSHTSLFAEAYDHVGNVLDQAQTEERNFALGQGSLLAMTTARASADIALSTAVAIASRLSQCASTLGNMSL